MRAEADRVLNVQIRDNDLDEIALAQLNGRQVRTRLLDPMFLGGLRGLPINRSRT